MTNFIIYALPRSRTKWLSEFLSYKDHTCNHDLAMTFRTPEDYKSYFSKKNTGSAETGTAQGYWLINHTRPDIKTVVIRRPLEESVSSLLDVDLGGMFQYDKELLTRHLSYTDRMLDEIEKQPDVLSVEYKDLVSSSSCKKIFEHCLPYDFDIKWWGNLKNKNIQINVKTQLDYYHRHKSEIDDFKRLCKLELIRLKRTGKI